MYLLHVEIWRELREDVCSQFVDDLLGGLGSTPSLTREGEEDAVKEDLCLLVVLGDVGILVQTKDFWVGDDGQRPSVFHVRGVFSVNWSVVQATGRKPVKTCSIEVNTHIL